MSEGGASKSQRETGGETDAEAHKMFYQLREKDAQIHVLQKKLQHFRSWVSSIHHKVQQMNPQAIKNSKRLYIGGIPADTTEDDLKQFMNSLMMKTGACTSPGNAVLSCKITTEKNYAFVELRSVEETSNAMAFDGIAFKDTYLKIRRPSNYDANTAIMLGPLTPDPTMDTANLNICRTVVEDSPHKLFVGGLPCDWPEEHVKDLLLPHGGLRSFNLVMDKITGKSKGYAFCEFVDDTLTDYVIKTLHGKKVGNKLLTVKRALEGGKGGGGGGGGGSSSSGRSPHPSPRGGMSQMGAPPPHHHPAMMPGSPYGPAPVYPPAHLAMIPPPPSAVGGSPYTPSASPHAPSSSAFTPQSSTPTREDSGFTSGGSNQAFSTGGSTGGGASSSAQQAPPSAPYAGSSPSAANIAGSLNGFNALVQPSVSI